MNYCQVKTILALSAPKFYLIVAIIWTGIITYFCLIKSSAIPGIANGLDKIGHFSFHFGMVIFWFLYFNARKKHLFLKINLRNAFLLSLFYGIFLELGQKYLTTTRNADIKDVLANSVGGLMAILLLAVRSNRLIIPKK